MTSTVPATPPPGPAGGAPALASSEQPEAAQRWQVWGMQAAVHLRHRDAAELLGLARSVVDVHVAAMDAAASRFRADSETSRLVPGQDCPASPLLRDTVRLALRAARLSDGAVVPTLGASLVAAGYDADLASLPGEREEVVLLAPRGHWRDVVVDDEAGTVRVPRGVRLDLGAIAKAHTADLAASAVHAATGGSVLVSLGGDLAVAGTDDADSPAS